MNTGLNNITGKEFPAWEQVVPSVGTSHSQRGNNMYSARDAKELQSCRHTLSILFEYAWSMARACLEYGKSMPRVWVEYGVMVVLLLVVGVGEVWGQETPVDYSGTYYIGSRGYNAANTSTNYYLCPTEGWAFYVATNNVQGNDNGQPFLTTYQCRNGKYDATKAVWIIEKEPNSGCYYIKQALTGRYIVSNGTLTGAGATRARVHLESVADAAALAALGDLALFEINYDNGHYDILPHSSDGRDGDNIYLVVNTNNYNQLDGNSSKTNGPTGFKNCGGIIGLYTHPDGNNAYFYLEVPAPTFSLNNENKVEITALWEANIYYTEDGTTPTADATLYTSPIDFSESEQKVIKAIAISGTKESAVVTLLNKPNVTLTTAGPYTYKAAKWEPAVELSYGSTQTTSGFSRTYSNNINAGNETASVAIADNNTSDDWFISNVPEITFSIKKATLTIKANDKTIGYGDDPNPNNEGVTYAGFAGNDNASKLGGSLSYTYTGDNSQPYTPYDSDLGKIGSYTITPYGQTSTNYDITYYPGTLTVTEKSIGDGTMAEDLILSIEADNSMTLKVGTHTLTPTIDYTIGNESTIGKYSSKRIDGTGNYTGYFNIRNAFVTFTSDAKEVEWSATFVAEPGSETDIGHALPKGITAYLISGIEDSWAIPEPLTYIPVGVPVLLVANEEKHGFLVEDANANSSDVTVITPDQVNNNLLTEVTDDPSKHFNTREIYVLYQNEFVLNTEGDMDKGKIYIPNPNYNNGGNAPSRLKIKWNTVSGITELRNNESTEQQTGIGWYTIYGRKLNGKPSAKGLYIVDGKKVMVK